MTTAHKAALAELAATPPPLSPLAPRLVYTPAEAGRMLSISRSRVFELIGSGDLPSFLHGRKRLIRHEVLVAYVDRIEAEAAS